MITVLFSCDSCGLVDATARVPARESPDDNVVDWFKGVLIPNVAEMHAILSPVCNAPSVQNVKVPIDERDPDGWIGKQTSVVPPRGDRGMR